MSDVLARQSFAPGTGGNGQTRVISGVFIDLGGVVLIGDRPVAGAIEAVRRLRAHNIALRFVTNTTRQSVRGLIHSMTSAGIEVYPHEILAPARTVQQYLERGALSPVLLVHPSLLEDFSVVPNASREAVVVGDAGDAFSYESLNRAYRALNAGAEFLALARNRSFRDGDGELSLDAGPFVAALEYAVGRQATVFGKPSPAFFQHARVSIGSSPNEVVMIGDDVEMDVEAAMKLGFSGLLVQTGKYQPGDERRIRQAPTAVVADLLAAVDWVLERCR